MTLPTVEGQAPNIVVIHHQVFWQWFLQITEPFMVFLGIFIFQLIVNGPRGAGHLAPRPAAEGHRLVKELSLKMQLMEVHHVQVHLLIQSYATLILVQVFY